MKIIVCVKQVLDTAAKINIKQGKVVAEDIPRILNPYDEFAVEEAVRIKEKTEATEITLVTVGPEGFRKVLQTGLAMGADRALHLLDPGFDTLDHLGIAHVLAKAIRSLPFDLILCGRQAVDDDMAQVGPALAEFLGIPCVSVVNALSFANDEKQAVVTRQVEGGSETLESSLPLLVTCQKGLNEPRLPSLKGIMKAKKKEIKIMNAAAIAFDPGVLQHSKGREVDLCLPPQREKGIILEGNLEESAAQLVKILREEIKVI